MDTPLAQLFAAAQPAARGEARSSELETALQSALQRARAALPSGTAFDDAAFVRHLAGRVAGPGWAGAISAAHVEDLALALACLKGSSTALAEFDRHVLEATTPALKRLSTAGGFVEEVQQLLRQKLLVSTDEKPAKLGDFAGRSGLGPWLRAAAIRVGLNLLESRHPVESLDEDLVRALPAPSEQSPELALVHQRYGPSLKAALEETLSTLPPRERNLLRLYFVQGLTVEQIGRMEGTHKSTISRRLTRARETLLSDVFQRLSESLRLSPPELESLIGLLQSQLHLSLVRVLR